MSSASCSLRFLRRAARRAALSGEVASSHVAGVGTSVNSGCFWGLELGSSIVSCWRASIWVLMSFISWVLDVILMVSGLVAVILLSWVKGAVELMERCSWETFS